MVETLSPVAARFVGQSVQRKEDRRLLTGHGRYVDDVVLPGMLHGAFLRSDVARADDHRTSTRRRPRRSRAWCAVFTWRDFDGRFGEAYHAMLGEALSVPPPLAIGDVRHVGDPIALVVAVSRYVAEDACDLIEVELDIRRRRSSTTAAAAEDTDEHRPRRLGPRSPTSWWPCRSRRSRRTSRRPSRRPPTSSSTTIEQNRYICVPMETRGIVADWQAGPRRDRHRLLLPERPRDPQLLRPLSRHPGGQHHASRPATSAAGSARRCSCSARSRPWCWPPGSLGRPVKWIEDRRENLIAAPHSRNEIGRVRLAMDADGTIEAITIDHTG